jgi:integrase
MASYTNYRGQRQIYLIGSNVEEDEMDDSLGSLGDIPADGSKQEIRYSQAKGSLALGLLPHRGIIPPRPIPPEVLIQLDKLLDQAIRSMVEGKEPAILSPTMWDAILILSRTGIRCSELTHLEASSQADQQGCLEQDSSGSWWLLIKAKGTKAGKEYRIPIHTDSGVIEAVHRQCLRISDIPDILDKHYLFRDDKGLLSSTAIRTALRKLAVHLTYEEQPYVIATHQFRHTIAQKTFELSKFMMGHASPSACQNYVYSRPTFLLKELDRLREKWDNLQHDEEQSDEEEQLSQEGEQQIEEQEGQEE